MKLKLIMIGLMVVMALSLLACSPEATEESGAPSRVHTQVDCDSLMKQKHFTGEVEIAIDGKLTVVLCSNPTTGFRWTEEAQISDTGVLKQVQHEFIGPESEPPPPPGTPGQEVWTFQALEKGTSTVSMEYSRPWESGEKGEWTFSLTVIVK